MTNTKIFNPYVAEMTIDEVVECYENMVHKIAHSMTLNTVCSYEDYVQEGRMAIVAAYTAYNPDKGASFTTYVYHMIKDAMLEYQKQHLVAPICTIALRRLRSVTTSTRMLDTLAASTITISTPWYVDS